MPSSLPKIAVFWDLDSCPPPILQLPPCELLKNIRDFTSSLGIVTSIRAYCDPKKEAGASHATAFRAEIPAMGVTLVDCSLMRGYNEAALTRMLAVDVLVFAVDHPVNLDTPDKNIIMIFSGNDSILYPVSLLVFRNYTVCLAVPDESNSRISFRNTATRVFSWQRDILRLAPGPKSASGSIGEHPRTQPPAHDRAQARMNPGTEVMPTPPPPPPIDINTTLSFPGSPQPFTSVSTPALPTPKMSLKSVPLTEASATRAPSVLSLNPEAMPFTVNSLRNGGSDSGRSDDIRDQMLCQLTRPMTPDNIQCGSWSVDTRPEPPRTHEVKSVPLPSGQETADTLAFEPLLRFLRNSLAEGKVTVLRSVVGAELAKKKDIYKAAGVTGFSQYIALATSRNLVTSGGVGGKEWVSLNSRFTFDL